MGVRPRGGGGGLISLRRDGGLRLSRLDEEELLRGGDLRSGGGLRERERMGLQERERCGGPPERDERSLEGVLLQGETSENGAESDIVDDKEREMFSFKRK
jgi:hypothetical protein